MINTINNEVLNLTLWKCIIRKQHPWEEISVYNLKSRLTLKYHFHKLCQRNLRLY